MRDKDDKIKDAVGRMPKMLARTISKIAYDQQERYFDEGHTLKELNEVVGPPPPRPRGEPRFSSRTVRSNVPVSQILDDPLNPGVLTVGDDNGWDKTCENQRRPIAVRYR